MDSKICRPWLLISDLWRRTIRMSVMRIAALAPFLTLIHSAPAVAQEKHMQLLAANTGWFLGQGKLRWTSNNGARWTDITPRMSLPGERISDVYFRDVNEGWVLLSTDENHAPEAAFEVASTTNSGGTWIITPVNVPGADAQSRAPLPGDGFIFFLDATHGWLNLGMEGGANFNPALLLATQNGGNTWIEETSPGRGTVLFSTPDQGWIAGGPGGEYLYSSKDGGMSWQTISLINPGAMYNSAPVFSDPKTRIPTSHTAIGAVNGLFATMTEANPGDTTELSATPSLTLRPPWRTPSGLSLKATSHR